MTHSSSAADLSVKSLFSFEKHVALVTGGATGIGEMAAQGLIQNGAKVFIASRKESELKAVSQKLPHLPSLSSQNIDQGSYVRRLRIDSTVLALGNANTSWPISRTKLDVTSLWLR